jgi:hypothetical protein
MSSNWINDLEQEINAFVAKSSPEETANLLERANFDYYNAVGAPIDGDATEGSQLIGTAELIPAPAVKIAAGINWDLCNSILVQSLVNAPAGSYEAMPLAA